jgi:hypothetical protein
MYILFFSTLAHELNGPARARKPAELTLWLVNLTSQVELARYLNESARTQTSRAELARYPPLYFTVV